MPPDPPKETAGVTTRLIIRYVREQVGAGGVADLLELAGEDRPVSVLEDERTWSTYEQKVALFEAAAKLLADPDAARHVGESVLRTRIGAPLRLLLWSLGSPSQLLKNIAKAGAKFSTVAELRYESGSAKQAVVTYRVVGGHEANEHDCGYTMGLLSQAPVMFGLGPAVVQHTRCQVSGADRCVYELTWAGRRRVFGTRRRARRVEQELGLMAAQVESLQIAAASVVNATTIDETVERIGLQMQMVVSATGYLVAVQPLVGGQPIVHSIGLTQDDVDDVLRQLTIDPEKAVRGRLVVPVSSSSRSYGHLVATFAGLDAFFADERRILTAFGTLAAAALDSAVSRETARALSGVAQALADVTSADEVCQRIADALPPVVGSPVATVARWDEVTAALHFVGVTGFEEDAAAQLRSVSIRPSDTPALLEQLESPEPRLFVKGAEDPFLETILTTFDVAAAMAVPMVARGTLLGHVILGWRTTPPEHLRGELVARMSGLAGLGATAMENARLLERTTFQAMHDSLTGLPNRVLLDDRLQQASALSRREQLAVGVLLLDLDGFKAVNDTFGHRVGDLVLCEVALRVQSVLRDADTAARLGGDEFVVVCPNLADEAEAIAVANRIEEVLAQPMTVGGSRVTVGASVGVAVVGSDAELDDLDDLLSLADEAMYAIKRERPERAVRFG